MDIFLKAAVAKCIEGFVWSWGGGRLREGEVGDAGISKIKGLLRGRDGVERNL